jgi:hypothetical protein
MIKQDLTMHKLEQHEMVLAKFHPSGGEEWYCPICGRSLLVTRKPKFMQIVLEAGNKYVSHTASKDGLQRRTMQLMLEDDPATEKVPDTLIEDARLAPYVTWMEAVGFEKLWNGDVQ